MILMHLNTRALRICCRRAGIAFFALRGDISLAGVILSRTQADKHNKYKQMCSLILSKYTLHLLYGMSWCE